VLLLRILLALRKYVLFHFKCHFSEEPESAGSHQFSSITCSGGEPLGISGIGFYRPFALPISQSVTEALTQTKKTTHSPHPDILMDS